MVHDKIRRDDREYFGKIFTTINDVRTNDAIVKRLYKEGVHPAEGLELEIAFGSGD